MSHHRLPDCIKLDELLSCHSTLGVGGPADYFVELKPWVLGGGLICVDSRLLQAYEYARDNGLDICTLGHGSNVLFADAGFRGLVLRIKSDGIHWAGRESDPLWVSAGTAISTLVNLGRSSGLSGFEWAAGLPGTVGGAVYGNAGCYGGQFWDLVKEVTFFDGEYVRTIIKQPDTFAYRWSIFKENPGWIILAVRLSVEPKAKKLVEAETKRVHGKRLFSQPLTRSAGCIFKNPVLKGEKVSAGKLIEEVGLKGTQNGQAMISHEHGNFFVNLGGATAANFLDLIALARGRVLNKFGVLLEEEIIRVGEF